MALRSIFVLLAVAAYAAAHQSPIDIEKTLDVKMPPLKFREYEKTYENYIKNTGHGAQITVKNWFDKPRVKGGPLFEEYALEQTHFHWGDEHHVGSEHKVHGHGASMEVHMVHYNTKYKSFEEAAKQPDGLMVIGFFLKGLEGYRNPAFDAVVEAIPKIQRADSKQTQVKADLIGWLIPYLEENNYYTYPGSLTTEPYSENVTWIFYKNFIPIGEEQVAAFRTIENHHGENLKVNFRELQNNEHVVVKYVH